MHHLNKMIKALSLGQHGKSVPPDSNRVALEITHTKLKVCKLTKMVETPLNCICKAQHGVLTLKPSIWGGGGGTL